jgi:hypothetical protein
MPFGIDRQQNTHTIIHSIKYITFSLLYSYFLLLFFCLRPPILVWDSLQTNPNSIPVQYIWVKIIISRRESEESDFYNEFCLRTAYYFHLSSMESFPTLYSVHKIHFFHWISSLLLNCLRTIFFCRFTVTDTTLTGS